MWEFTLAVELLVVWPLMLLAVGTVGREFGGPKDREAYARFVEELARAERDQAAEEAARGQAGAGEGADGASGDGNANGNGGAANEFEMNPVHEQGYEEVELSVPPTIRAIEEEPRGWAGEARDDSIWSGSRLASG